MIGRREFFADVGAIALWPVVLRAQSARQPLVGVLVSHFFDPAFSGFQSRLQELGYEDGRNMHLLVRSADGKLDQLPRLAAELVVAKVDVIVSIYTPGTRAAINATKEVPIVMGIVGDPVGTGFVSTLARPGGNVTGISNISAELASKRLQILKEIVPAMKRVAALFNPDDPITKPQIKDTEQAALQLAVEARFFPVRNTTELESAFTALVDWQAQGAFWLAGQATAFAKGTITLASKHRLPTMLGMADQVRAGGLISYFPDHEKLYRRVAEYVDLILKGAKPGDLPVEQPTKFELVINLKTAKALGLIVPPSLLARADEVIE